jgi:integrase
VQQAKEDNGEPKIFTPTEMRELLAAARPEMIPFLSIGGFAGLRSVELTRLDWSDVNLRERYIEIKAAKAKTGARRLAPITDNLFAWLELHAKETGAVLGFESWWNQIPKLVDVVNEQRKQQAEEAGKKPASLRKFQWKHNALRHSFCSYRLAGTKNAAQVALEAGNSPQIIFAHYRQLVTESEAAKWFAVSPPKAAENVIPFGAAANT